MKRILAIIALLLLGVQAQMPSCSGKYREEELENLPTFWGPTTRYHTLSAIQFPG